MIKDTKFKKGQIPWNKGKHNTWLIGIPRTKEVREKISSIKNLWLKNLKIINPHNITNH